jgi:hypothetical protein
MKIKIILIVIACLLTACIRKGSDRLVRLKDSLQVNAKNIVYRKGLVIINDKYVLSGATVQIVAISTIAVQEKTKPLYRPKNKSYQPNLYDLDGPYKMTKKADNDTIVITKGADTLYFKFISLE